MDEKSINIIEQSIKLFAKKGFSSTSVQEIANECGISKGAFYLHFKSKDALLLEIFNYYYSRIQSKIEEIQSEGLDPRTNFKKQLRVTFEEIAQHREFIIMQIREQAIPFNDNIESFIKQMRFNSYMFYKRHFLAIYGKEIDGILWEVSLLMEGMFKAFLDLIILEDARLNLEALCEALLRRTDFIVEGFTRSGDQPVITEEFISQIIPEEFLDYELDDIIQTLKNLQHHADEDIQVTITVLLEEIQSTDPRRAVIRGMLTNIDGEKKFENVSDKIRKFYQL
ncbi:TetR/AcrR family transcriptional regulator [Thalassobacillus pellis]|uniref:TetR/AcrR family transcriptional regulator n=1 Tax=Thalassobacillus pellis TaxID=748008 RepID=UPI00196137D8|nr:TetR/AcrR family transcriptional regulator [Thalassobacillus pellis]MBM7554792.1 AcrR family transcriptional regulator [Thalassobacillus pellis]